ncbi:MAG: hypothetical protein GWN99_03785 [Gemmatimonadetes bacterium]|uniref:Flippase-like domain-containing protein n=1 Tax=Candidatus Kutchimonas denitrificans TaxID=3056748 RepID=A0AAE4ZBL0_9BACT|nr:hypothetical protein [Gemmatimonadota bacterium]NIR75251.1 hypothetical protein [Candidatus Kutchimonas denitrificans]NIS00189.1 hypothetical protein [Gemmatimonadota bacterium]NIT65781.1 hypothetical protein [Gemmatimonadota bacterium]NIU53059.1 hypothetical protein [Gemmatimonadota bacterium]
MDERVRRGAGWALRLALTLLVTYFIFRSLRVSWAELAETDLARWQPAIAPLAASLAALLFVFAYLVALWARMVTGLGGPVLRLGAAIRIFFLANLGRYIPGKVWQLAGLTYLAGKRGVSIPIASSSAVLSQVYSLGAAAAVAAIGLLLTGVAQLPAGTVPFAVALAAAVIAVTTVPPVLRLLLRLVFRFSRRGELAPDLDRWFGFRWLFAYLPGWIGYGLAFLLLCESFPNLPPVAPLAAIGSFAGAYFLGYAAVFAPAGVGVREGALAFLLAPALGAAEATVLAVFARVWMTVAELGPAAWAGIHTVLGAEEGESETREHGS